MKKTLFCLLFCCTGFLSFSQSAFTSWVNPFIGTGGHGHTYPGATLPFGMVQVSPDTRLSGWDGSSGYHYSDSLLYGFSHTHLSGTGAVDYGDVLLMPFSGQVRWKSADYASPFSHQNEKASPGYYEVLLKKNRIQARLTATLRAGLHQYRWPAGTRQGAVLIDLQHRDQVLESYLEKVSDTEIRGYRRSQAWARDQRLYFTIRFERPIQDFVVLDDQGRETKTKFLQGRNLKVAVRLNLNGQAAAQVKVGLSAVDAAGASRNLQTEMPGWDFEAYRQAADAAWEKELGKIAVKGGTSDQKTIFYTALYHSLLSPNLYQDVDGRFRSTDLQVHKPENFTNYTVFSLWDTYRALHPLMTLIQQQKTSDWINTFLAQYRYGGMLPVWELSGNETFTMNGYHAVSVIWDAYQKGIRSFDANLALQAARQYAEGKRFGLGPYQQSGYVPNDQEPESVSKTMEYAYDDWCIAQLAKALGQQDIYRQYLARARAYQNLFDPQSRHIRGKKQALWHSPFEPREINTFFTEGNAWQYAFAAPQDISGLMGLYGTEAAFVGHLEELFSTSSQTTGFANEDVSGFIGQYAHGNEPSHHLAYLFSYAGMPWRSQELIYRIIRDFYKNEPDGLIGNEDCGQMSAWLVMSALGFYPVCPGNGDYVLGTPLFEEATIQLENNKTFTIKAPRATPASFYVSGAQLNGRRHTRSWLSHQEIMQGGLLQLKLQDKPDKTFGQQAADRPVSAITGPGFVPVPYVNGESHRFRGQRTVSLHNIDKDADLYYQISDSLQQAPDLAQFRLYTGPFSISASCVVRVFAQKGKDRSALAEQRFLQLPEDKSIEVLAKIHPMYTAGEPEALIDGVLGNHSWRTGEWQCYPSQDFEAIVDLKKVQLVQYVGVQVFQFLGPSILYPQQLQVSGSIDGKTYFPLASAENTRVPTSNKEEMQLLGAALQGQARYLRVKATNGGKLPSGGPSRIFISEVVVR